MTLRPPWQRLLNSSPAILSKLLIDTSNVWPTLVCSFGFSERVAKNATPEHTRLFYLLLAALYQYKSPLGTLRFVQWAEVRSYLGPAFGELCEEMEQFGLIDRLPLDHGAPLMATFFGTYSLKERFDNAADNFRAKLAERGVEPPVLALPEEPPAEADLPDAPVPPPLPPPENDVEVVPEEPLPEVQVHVPARVVRPRLRGLFRFLAENPVDIEQPRRLRSGTERRT